MTYVVLARKYRPRVFAHMVGQEAVVRTLTSALSAKRLHHAYLFTGTRGVGKTTVSRILAKSLNCTGPDGQGGITAEPCGVCAACTAIDADRYVDYVELDAASNRGIDEIRDLLDRAAYKPTVGRFKVFMIDEAHQLTKDSFNALLKTLEEPPDYLKFVLATTDPERMLPTVLSRCLQFNLRPIAPPVVEAHLADVLNQEGVPFEAAALAVLGRAARGSMRDALSLTDQAIAYGQGRLGLATVRDMLGAVDENHALALLAAAADGDARAMHTQVQALRQQGLSAQGAVDALLQALQSVAARQALPDLDVPGDEGQSLADLADRWDPQAVHLLYAMLLKSRDELGHAPDEHDALLMVFWRHLSFARPEGATAARPPAAERPLRRPAVHEARLVVDPVPRPQVAPAIAAPPSPEVDMDRWCGWVQALCESQAVTALVRELAVQAQWRGCESLEGDRQRWKLCVSRDSLASPVLAQRLAEALSAQVGHGLDLVVTQGDVDDSVALRESAEKTRRQAEAERIIRDDPVVQSLLSEFPGARVVPGSIHPR